VRAPVLIVHGEEDRLVPVSFSAAIAETFGWRLEVLPGAGHVPMLEVPDQFLRVTEGWLASQRPIAA
jgi:pimeloyl-ACP methyl ester carboxylesterase